MTQQLRAILPLLKARVVERGNGYFKLAFGYEHGSPTTIMVTHHIDRIDLHDGDLLQLYTEVLLTKPEG